MRLLLLSALAVALAGCGSLDDLYRQAERASGRTYDGRYDRDSRDLRRGVDRYVRDVDRAVRLSNRQERRVRDVLYDRADRYAYRGGRYADDPFPRSRRASREADRFWRDADRAIERELDRRQRDRYRRFTRRFEDRSRDRNRRDNRWERRDRDDDDDDWDDDGR